MTKRIHQRPDTVGSGKSRKCLKCGKAFPSEGIHNRICAKCKTSPDFRSAVDTATYYRGRGTG